MMKDSTGKFFPQPTVETRKYWNGCHNHELLLQQCSDCREFQFYPRMICINCMSNQLEWIKASIYGKVVTYTVIHRPVSKAYASEVPYVIALIRLDEGPMMMSNIIQCDPDTVEIGMKVEVVFEDWSDEITIPKFCPTAK